MFAQADVLTLIFGSLGGIAALVVAINTWLVRREARQQKKADGEGTLRMDTFETSQTSLTAALLRADIENERLRLHVSDQDKEIDALKASEVENERLRFHVEQQDREIGRLKVKVEETVKLRTRVEEQEKEIARLRVEVDELTKQVEVLSHE